ncbi:MAG: Ferrous iron transport protein B [Candidatus Anoxychlamydiales bacterium]|nr:Ferrous iron transport protein B [Candidatus Anoxychlamydiales bacterium]
MLENKIKVALVGNPNSGKTTLFNQITNFNQKTGNYSGVTVEKKIGIKKINDENLHIIDLPGLYSFNPVSEEETVARNHILNEEIDVIINVIDASNLKKSLFLTTQLLELNCKVIIALNMSDIAKKTNQEIDIEKLKKILNVDVVPIVAIKKNNFDTLFKKIIENHTSKKEVNRKIINYSDDIERHLDEISDILEDKYKKDLKRFYAVKLLEKDETTLKELNLNSNKFLEVIWSKINNKNNDPINLTLTKKRNEYINLFIKEIINNNKPNKNKFLEKLDDVLTNKFLGPIIFLLVMYLIFQITFSLSEIPTKIIENSFSIINKSISNIWPETFYTNLRSLVLDGIISGVGSVIMFLPNIMLLFFSISILEESGYMTRAVFVLDKLMYKIGLNGKSIIPLIIGFGCSVPAMLATRTLDSKKDKIITIFALPLISCSAKLVVFSMFIPAFFEKKYQPLVLFLLYLIGIVLAIILIKFLNIAFFKKKKTSFIMEMPKLLIPSTKVVFIQMLGRAKDYIKNAGTIIVAFSIIIWALTSFPKNLNNETEATTYIEKIGKKLDPIFKPLGFDWRINTSLISSFVAKEVFIAQIGVIYSTNNETKNYDDLQKQLKNDYSNLQAFCIMLFILVSSPCIATIAATRKELKSYTLAFVQFFSLTFLAYILTFVVYQIGTLLGFN